MTGGCGRKRKRKHVLYVYIVPKTKILIKFKISEKKEEEQTNSQRNSIKNIVLDRGFARADVKVVAHSINFHGWGSRKERQIPRPKTAENPNAVREVIV